MPALQLVEQRAGERVADDEQEVQLLALDEAPDVIRLEPLRDGLDEHGSAAEPRPKAHPVTGAVHERGSQERPQTRVGLGQEAVDRGRRLRPTEALDHRVAVAPHDALRHPGRAAGVEDVQVVGAPLDRRT